MSKTNLKVSGVLPFIVKEAIRAIKQKGPLQFGIYYVCGHMGHLNKLKQEVRNEVYEFDKYNPCVLADYLLYHCLGSHDPPIVPVAIQAQIVYIIQLDERVQNHKEKVVTVKMLLKQLPESSYEALKHFCKHLIEYSQVDDGRITIDGLASKTATMLLYREKLSKLEGSKSKAPVTITTNADCGQIMRFILNNFGAVFPNIG